MKHKHLIGYGFVVLLLVVGLITATQYDSQQARDDNGDVLNMKAPMARIIHATGATMYVCEAAPGTLIGEEDWQIKREVVSGDVATLTYANGTWTYSHNCTNRAALAYS